MSSGFGGSGGAVSTQGTQAKDAKIKQALATRAEAKRLQRQDEQKKQREAFDSALLVIENDLVGCKSTASAAAPSSPTPSTPKDGRLTRNSYDDADEIEIKLNWFASHADADLNDYKAFIIKGHTFIANPKNPISARSTLQLLCTESLRQWKHRAKMMRGQHTRAVTITSAYHGASNVSVRVVKHMPNTKPGIEPGAKVLSQFVFIDPGTANLEVLFCDETYSQLKGTWTTCSNEFSHDDEGCWRVDVPLSCAAMLFRFKPVVSYNPYAKLPAYSSMFADSHFAVATDTESPTGCAFNVVHCFPSCQSDYDRQLQPGEANLAWNKVANAAYYSFEEFFQTSEPPPQSILQEKDDVGPYVSFHKILESANWATAALQACVVPQMLQQSQKQSQIDDQITFTATSIANPALEYITLKNDSVTIDRLDAHSKVLAMAYILANTKKLLDLGLFVQCDPVHATGEIGPFRLLAPSGHRRTIMLSNVSLVHACNHYSGKHVRASFDWLFRLAENVLDCRVNKSNFSISARGKAYTVEGGTVILKMAMCLRSQTPTVKMLDYFVQLWYTIGTVDESKTFSCPNSSVFHSLFRQSHPLLCALSSR